MDKYKLFHGDCLDLLPSIEDQSIDAIITDLPYGTTNNKWDSIIPLDRMWAQVKRICKGVFVTTAAQPFTSILVTSNLKMWKQELIWDKEKGSNPLLAKTRHMQSHEDVEIFCNGKMTYNPQMIKGKKYKAPRTGSAMHNRSIGGNSNSKNKEGFKQADNLSGDRYPLSVLTFPIHVGSKDHPTEKPLSLYEYFILTFTNENDLVLDFCMGSGTTGEACMKLNRKFIGIEKEKGYFDLAEKNIREASQQMVMFAE